MLVTAVALNIIKEQYGSLEICQKNKVFHWLILNCRTHFIGGLMCFSTQLLVLCKCGHKTLIASLLDRGGPLFKTLSLLLFCYHIVMLKVCLLVLSFLFSFFFFFFFFFLLLHEKGIWYGVEWDDERGKHDGSLNGVSYFHCR